MGDADCGVDPLDPALHQLDVGVVAQAEVVQPLSLGPGDVTWRGTALRVGVCVVPDEGLPVRVTRPFDRRSKLFPGEKWKFPDTCMKGGSFVSALRAFHDRERQVWAVSDGHSPG